jgi:hypothetical protein
LNRSIPTIARCMHLVLPITDLAVPIATHRRLIDG